MQSLMCESMHLQLCHEADFWPFVIIISWINIKSSSKQTWHTHTISYQQIFDFKHGYMYKQYKSPEYPPYDKHHKLDQRAWRAGWDEQDQQDASIWHKPTNTYVNSDLRSRPAIDHFVYDSKIDNADNNVYVKLTMQITISTSIYQLLIHHGADLYTYHWTWTCSEESHAQTISWGRMSAQHYRQTGSK